MKDKYKELRQCICHSEQELMRFRQLLVNAVIATDIADKELQQRQKKRWDKAFHCGSEESLDDNENKNDMDRKATMCLSTLYKLPTYHTPCNIGMCTSSGMSGCKLVLRRNMIF